jgi:hypothetical protein
VDSARVVLTLNGFLILFLLTTSLPCIPLIMTTAYLSRIFTRLSLQRPIRQIRIRSYSSVVYSSASQIDEEVAKLLELKAQIKDDGPQKFQLKVPKVIEYELIVLFSGKSLRQEPQIMHSSNFTIFENTLGYEGL